MSMFLLSSKMLGLTDLTQIRPFFFGSLGPGPDLQVIAIRRREWAGRRFPSGISVSIESPSVCTRIYELLLRFVQLQNWGVGCIWRRNAMSPPRSFVYSYYPLELFPRIWNKRKEMEKKKDSFLSTNLDPIGPPGKMWSYSMQTCVDLFE